MHHRPRCSLPERYPRNDSPNRAPIAANAWSGLPPLLVGFVLDSNVSGDAGFRRHFKRMFKLALGVRALGDGPGFQIFFDQVTAAAFRALLRNRPAPSHEIAVGVTAAPVEGRPALGPSFNYFALRAVRARHSDGFLLYVFALRVVAAGHELPVTPVFLYQVAVATRALLFERHIFALFAADLFSRLAIRVAGAGVKLPKATLLENHRTAAVFTVFS